MTEAILDIKTWGKSRGVRLPAAVARAARLHADQRVRITVEAPERQDVIWIDCSPRAGGETRDLHPMPTLSPGVFNDRAGLVIGLPRTTASFNATNPFALAKGSADGSAAGQTSDVLCHQSNSFDWLARCARPHPQGRLTDAAFVQAGAVLNASISLA